MWVVRLTDKQLEVLRALLRSEEHLGPALRGSIEANGYTLRVESVRENRIEAVRISGSVRPPA